MRDRRLLLIAAAAYVALFAVLLHAPVTHAPLVLYASAIVFFLVLITLLRRVDASPRFVAITIVVIAVALQIVAWTTGPTSSDDVYRYLWDARVQFAGVDPYTHPPSSPVLAPLRDHALFPGGHCPHPFPGGCTLINRPAVRTVYPPFAQLAFDAVRLASGGGHFGVRPFQIAGGAGVLAITVLLLRWRRDRPSWPVALWAWSPLVVTEFGNNAHLDWLAVLLALAGLRAAGSGRAARSGVLLALATLTKLYPAVLLPAVLRRHPVRVLVAGAVTGVLLYLPHVLAVGAGVVGYLPGYLQEEGYNSGTRLLLLGTVLPHPADTIVGVILLAGVAWWAYRYADPTAPERAAVVLLGATFLVFTPSFGWYAGLLLALIALTQRWEWTPLALAPALVYLTRTEITTSTVPESSIYLAAALAVAAGFAVRLRAERRDPTSRHQGRALEAPSPTSSL